MRAPIFLSTASRKALGNGLRSRGNCRCSRAPSPERAGIEQGPDDLGTPPEIQVATITHRQDGYFIVHVDSEKADDFPLLDGNPIGAQATRLTDNDVIQLAGVKMGFFEG